MFTEQFSHLISLEVNKLTYSLLCYFIAPLTSEYVIGISSRHAMKSINSL